MKGIFEMLRPWRRMKQSTAIIIMCIASIIVGLMLLFKDCPKVQEPTIPVYQQWSAEEIFQNNKGRELLRVKKFKKTKTLKVAVLPEEDAPPKKSKGIYAQHYTPIAADEYLRAEEKYVRFDPYIACLEEVLHVDIRRKRELPWGEDDEAFPYVVLPVNVELSDVKATMCSLDVYIRHLMYVIEGTSSTTMDFFKDVATIFAFTQRLKIHYVPALIGYANIINAGLLDAMKLPRDEVPFFTVLSHSVRIPDVTVRASIKSFYNVSVMDAAVTEALQHDLESEPNAHTPLRFPCALRSFQNKSLVSTSSLLPDSIRYLPLLQLEEQFKAFDGLLLFESLESFQSDVYGMTRLAMETVGFMDENILSPEAVVKDWNARRLSLGFKVRVPRINADRAGARLNRLVDGKTLLSYRFDAPDSFCTNAQVWAKVLNHVDLALLDYAYIKRKYGDTTEDEVPAAYLGIPVMPADAWILDVLRRTSWFNLVQSIKNFFFNGDTPHKAKRSVNRSFPWIPAKVWDADCDGPLFTVMGTPFPCLMETMFSNNTLTPV